MKKTIYCKPEIEVTKLNLNQLLNSVSGNVGDDNIGYGGVDNGENEGDAKGFWDDEY
ncbi:MAG: hypothetical protein IJ624_05955 [Prevotella sp.]|nr:hypothetical protein [Prevotella sp.]